MVEIACVYYGTVNYIAVKDPSHPSAYVSVALLVATIPPHISLCEWHLIPRTESGETLHAHKNTSEPSTTLGLSDLS